MCLRINLHFLKMINNFYLHMLTKYVLLKCLKKPLIRVAVVAYVQGKQVTVARNNV